MMIGTPKKDGSNGVLKLYECMRLIRFETRRRSGKDVCGAEGDVQLSNTFSVSKCCGDVDGRTQFKVMLADVPLDQVGLFSSILKCAESRRRSPMFNIQSEIERTMLVYGSAVSDKKLTMGTLVYAVELAHELFQESIDLTVDASGALNSDAAERGMRVRGLEVSNATKCGINCVHAKSREVDGVGVTRTLLYNKLAETMQQGSVRSNEADDKCAYLLNPTTKRLSVLFRDSEHYENGTTRLELTLGRVRPADSFPNFEKLVGIMESNFGLLFEPGVLVSCSLQEHIQVMGNFVTRSVAVHFPSISEAKSKQLAEQGPRLNGRAVKQLKKQLNGVPEGFLLRWYNSLTGKFNGYPIYGHFAGRGDRCESAGGLVVKSLGWASSCKADPVLFVCVAGAPGCQEASGQAPRSMYFRRVGISRTGGPLSTYLPHHCGFKRDNFKNHVTDWGRVGVQPDALDNLRFALVDPSITPTFLTMGGLDIEVSEAPDAADDVSIIDSEGRAEVTGIPRRYYNVADHNGALSTWKPWASYKICSVGKHKTEKVRFQVGSDWFWAPVGVTSRRLIEHLEGSPSTVCEVQMDSGNNFCWREAGVAKVFGRCFAARALPVDARPYGIIGGGLERAGRKTMMYIWVGEGRYYVPKSIREQVLAALGVEATDEAVDSFLNGKLILHAASRFERVRGQPNLEELLVIVDPSGSVHATNVDEGWKRQCR
jgi:hypothetical protein